MEETRMQDRPVAVKLQGVKKRYILGQIGGGTLQADLQSWWAKVRGKTDPNKKIDQEERIVGRTFMALNGIDLTIYQGERIGIIGGNGAGKSTMLKLLSKVTAPTSGEIDIYGRIASMLEVGTGFNPEMTGRENIYMNGAILGMTKEEIDTKMENIIEFSEVREFIDTPVKRYSSGMYVKLAFSVAAHLDSEILIMDEVLAVGDMAFQTKCLNKMREVATEDGKTVLYVSHNMNTIRRLCDRCIVLEKGKIIYDGEVEKAISFYNGAKDSMLEGEYDVSERVRTGLSEKEMYLEKISVPSTTVDMNEDYKFSLRIHSNKITERALLRCVITSRDGASIGFSATNEFHLSKGKNEIDFAFSTCELRPGIFGIDFILCENTAFDCMSKDRVSNIAAMCVGQSGAPYNDYWGAVRFTNIKVIDH
jgi:lipopolysaccharide transport system ATP-binding protein